MTATTFGSKKARIDAVAASCDRSAEASVYSTVRSSDSVTRKTPASRACFTPKPERRNTSIIWLFPPSTNASNARTPRSRAILGEPLQQPGAKTAALQRVGDRERDLRARRVGRVAIVTGDAGQHAAPLGDEHESILVSDVDDLAHAREIQLRKGHEPVEQALLGKTLEQRQHGVGVGGTRGTEAQGLAVAEDDVGIEIRRGRSHRHMTAVSIPRASRTTRSVQGVLSPATRGCRKSGSSRSSNGQPDVLRTPRGRAGTRCGARPARSPRRDRRS